MELLEREIQLDKLSARLTAAAKGQGSMVLIAGEAGAGKTSLVRAFASGTSKGSLALFGACDPLTTPRALGPLLDVVANPDSGLSEVTAELSEPFTLFVEVIDRLRVTSRPIVLVIEDVHWADDGTLDFLRFLGRRIADTKALALRTYRDDEVGPEHPLRKLLGELLTLPTVSRLEVPPLSVEAVRVLGAHKVADPERLHLITGGNAFYVTEVIAGGPHLPTSVQDAVLARVARLGPGARRVVEAVAIAPRELEPYGDSPDLSIPLRVVVALRRRAGSATPNRAAAVGFGWGRSPPLRGRAGSPGGSGRVRSQTRSGLLSRVRPGLALPDRLRAGQVGRSGRIRGGGTEKPVGSEPDKPVYGPGSAW